MAADQLIGGSDEHLLQGVVCRTHFSHWLRGAEEFTLLAQLRTHQLLLLEDLVHQVVAAAVVARIDGLLRLSRSLLRRRPLLCGRDTVRGLIRLCLGGALNRSSRVAGLELAL